MTNAGLSASSLAKHVYVAANNAVMPWHVFTSWIGVVLRYHRAMIGIDMSKFAEADP
jgi:hypothetical protein